MKRHINTILRSELSKAYQYFELVLRTIIANYSLDNDQHINFLIGTLNTRLTETLKAVNLLPKNTRPYDFATLHLVLDEVLACDNIEEEVFFATTSIINDLLKDTTTLYYQFEEVLKQDVQIPDSQFIVMDNGIPRFDEQRLLNLDKERINLTYLSDTRDLKYRQLIDNAEEAFYLDQLESSLNLYKKANSIYENCDGLSGIGKVYLARKSYQSAESSFMKAIELNPQYGPAYVDLGILFYELKQYERALEFLNISSKLSKHYMSHVGFIYSGKIHLQQRDYENAITSFKSALSIDPSLTEIAKLVEELENNVINIKGSTWQSRLENSTNI